MIDFNQSVAASAASEGLWPRTGNLPAWKRVLDLLFLVILAPAVVVVGALVALTVRCGSRGPVFFRQERVGYRGHKFLLYKFRTMEVDAETESHRSHTRDLIKSEAPMTKLDVKNDPRLIPFGACLRSTGLDELPQLLNVLRGEMSLVGPRPCLPYEYELYEPWHRRRLDAVPGLTGLWQVSGKNRTTFEQMVRLDIAYAERQSLSLDLEIILKTVPVLWTQWREDCAARSEQGVCTSSNMGKSIQSYRL